MMHLCACGCKQLVLLSKKTGKPNKFINGHNARTMDKSYMQKESYRAKQREAFKDPDVISRHRSSLLRGKNHPHYSPTSDASYSLVHKRLREERWIGVCEHCGGTATDLALIFERGTLINDKNQKYSVNRDDYMELCKSCHTTYDKSLWWALKRDKS